MQIGRQHWMNRTSGDLGLKDRITLLSHSLLPVIQQTIKSYALAHHKQRNRMQQLSIEDLVLPDSSDVQQALAQMQSCSAEALQNHCLRTWCYAIAFAKMQPLQCDAELLAVSCLLHDLGDDNTALSASCTLPLLCRARSLCGERLVNSTRLVNRAR
ncbi:HD domain protein [Acinetobacter sp. 1000160]|nr:HD domain protein [Acinetobacter baumannii 146457]EYT19767.1 HD domain protein [Acinetobacter sp. 1000160]